MFTHHKEIIWHITCDQCKFYWTYATMEEQFKITVLQLVCPQCGIESDWKDGRVDECTNLES
jgi:Zn finger protein HypA/HybF involved in hydrogenase expression